MSIFLPVKTATIILPYGPVPHLFILLTDPVGASKSVLALPVSSYDGDGTDDEACKLFPGDHDFINKKSLVRYRRARIEAAQTLVNGAKDGAFKPMHCLKTDVFARVCHGVSTSMFVRPHIRKFYEANK